MSSGPEPRAEAVRVPEFAPEWAFFLDVGGTLLNLAEHPAAVQVAAGLTHTLQSLAQRTDTPVALISGRAIVDLDRLFAPKKAKAIACACLPRRR